MRSYRYRLTSGQRKDYDKSNVVSSIPVRVSPRLAAAVPLLEETLRAGDRGRTERIAQVLCDELCAALGVAPVKVAVAGNRPSNRRGELHGLYVPGSGGRRSRIEVWMVTAKRGQVVAFKTFVRTLLHEICHHLDYHLLRLGESFHTDGFFKRESSLFHQLQRPVETRT
jgi:hypothetical protein